MEIYSLPETGGCCFLWSSLGVSIRMWSALLGSPEKKACQLGISLISNTMKLGYRYQTGAGQAVTGLL